VSVTIVNGDSVQAGVSSNGLIVEVAVSQSNGSVMVVGGGAGGGPVQIGAPTPGSSPVSVTSGAQSTNAVQVQVSPGIGPSIVVNGTSTSIVGTAGINPFIAGENITITTTGGGITVIGRDPPVLSVNGRTGSVVLSVVDLTAASASHSHLAKDVSDFSDAAAAASPVQSVAGRVGNVTLTTTDISQFTTGVRTFSRVQSVSGRTGVVSLTTTDISGLTAAIQSFSKVLSVQGKDGNVALTVSDITAAAASHTHSISDVGLSASDLVPPQAGQTGRYLKSVEGVATWAAVPIGGGGGGGSAGLFLHEFGSQPTLALSAASGGGTGASLAISGYQRIQDGPGSGYFKVLGISILAGGSGYTDFSPVTYTLGEDDEELPDAWNGFNWRIRTIFDPPPNGPWVLTTASNGTGLSVSLSLERSAVWPYHPTDDTTWYASLVTIDSGGTGYAVGDILRVFGPTTLTSEYGDFAATWLAVTEVGPLGQVTEIEIATVNGWLHAGVHAGINTGVIGSVYNNGDYYPWYGRGAFLKDDGSGTSLEQGSGKYRVFMFPAGKSPSVLLPPAAMGAELYVMNGGQGSLSLEDQERDITHSLPSAQAWILLVSLGTPKGWLVMGSGYA